MKSLKEKLDDIFSQYIRLRDSNSDGIGRCISCQKTIPWSQADNGHYINRQHMNTRYDPENCNLQCRDCNRDKRGNLENYKIGLTEKLGTDIHNKLTQAKHQRYDMSIDDYQDKIKFYRSEVKKLKARKTLIR